MNIVRQCLKFIAFIIVLFVLNCSINNISSVTATASSTNNNNVNETFTKCCNTSSGPLHRVEIEFKSTVVQNEYIVKFDGYYSSQTRKKYLTAALNDSKVSIKIKKFKNLKLMILN